ncbi:hypothetical protein [Kluyvera intermedia]|uniref:Uncharacterized protein n=1 Tax=Kluyvera intermedia TaxID=61648 RepID=A0AA95FXC3_KLUIN|nr:hypothetical protein [Kluyvera intermedia]WGL54638.1 hypothetical protein QBD33_13235 [Kluyvera intermedia]
MPEETSDEERFYLNPIYSTKPCARRQGEVLELSLCDVGVVHDIDTMADLAAAEQTLAQA